MSTFIPYRSGAKTMSRTALLSVAILLMSVPLAAQSRGVSGRPSASPTVPSVVSGTVSSVSGNIIAIAGGEVTIDASRAKIVTRGGERTIAAVTPGMQIHATVGNDVAPDAPLEATMVAIVEMPELFMLGEVQSVDPLQESFVVLGRTVHVTGDTSFGGGFVQGSDGLDMIQPRQIVSVQADVQGTTIFAQAVHVVSQFAGTSQLVHGTVRSIGTDQWVITGRDERDVRVTVNAQTRIAGNPKVGDVVTVLTATDSSNGLVAVFIVRTDGAGADAPNLGMQRFEGTVKATGSVWTIAQATGSDISVHVQPNKTRILGAPRVGDRVDVVAEKNGEQWLALLIAKRMW